LAKADPFSLATLWRRATTRQASKEGLDFASGIAQTEDCSCPQQMPRFIYVYILQSEADPNHFYIGRTQDLRARILRHNAGQVRHTSKWKPWRLKTYIALSDSGRAIALEHYLKSASGRAFIKKRL
jgi:predicted GIY-YIG superfamily endonuclease